MVFRTNSFHLINPFQLLSNLFLKVSSFIIVDSGLLNDLRSSFDHEHISINLFLAIAISFHVIESRLKDVVDPRKAALAKIPIFVQRWAIL